MVGIACLFDFLDGLVARALHVHSEIGKQLDSLADMVSFGVVPGVLMFKLINKECITCGEDMFSAAPLSFFGFLITIFSAVRLAKFNLDIRQTDSFIGLPTPANTIFISSLALIINLDSSGDTIKHFILHPYFLVGLTVIFSFLLIVPLHLFALKFKNFSWTDNKVRYVFLALALALLIVFQFVGIPLIIILYVILSIINNIVTKSQSQP